VAAAAAAGGPAAAGGRRRQQAGGRQACTWLALRAQRNQDAPCTTQGRRSSAATYKQSTEEARLLVASLGPIPTLSL
jgi:hypothetical protein